MQDSRVLSVLEWLERFVYRHADRIVPVTDAFKRYMLEKGVDQKKIDVIKNGANLSLFTAAASSEVASLREELGIGNRFVAAYVGTHGMAHHLETLLEAADRLRDQPGIVFLMVGDGARKDDLVRLKEEMKLDNVIMLGQLPKDRMPAIWGLTDVSLVLLKKTPVFETVIPSKIFESMAMKRPIVLGVRGESQTIVEEAGSGVCIEPENADMLARTILDLSRNPEKCRRMGERGRAVVESVYNRSVLAQRYLDVIGNTIEKKKSSRS